MEQTSNPNPEQSVRIAEFLTEPIVLVMKSETTEQSLKAIALFVDRVLNGADAGTPNAENGFVVLAFPAERPGACNYISNRNREDIIASMKAFVARGAGQMG